MNGTGRGLLLVVAAKEPAPGRVKTRLTPELTPQQAATLYRCMLDDRLEEMRDLTGTELAIAFFPPGARASFAALAPERFSLMAQRGRDLGERMHNLLADSFNAGYRSVVLVGSDSPDLPKSLVQEAFLMLQSGRAEVVLGPSHDGGYYLIGMQRPHPVLFAGISWSTDSVLSTTLARARENSIATELLPCWHDLDIFEDLVDFYWRYKERRVKGEGKRAERTFAFVSGFLRHQSLSNDLQAALK